MNRVELQGILAFDVKAVYGEKKWASFTLRIDREGTNGFDGIKVTVFSDNVDLVAKANKGQPIKILGKLNTSSYERDGKKISVLNVIGETVELLESPKSEETQAFATSDELPY